MVYSLAAKSSAAKKHDHDDKPLDQIVDESSKQGHGKGAKVISMADFKARKRITPTVTNIEPLKPNPVENKGQAGSAATYHQRMEQKRAREELTPGQTKQLIDSIKTEQKDITDKMPEFNSGWDRWKSRVRNVKNICVNMYENTVGNVLSGYENWKSRRALKKDSNKDIVYLAHGYFQNRGSMRQLAKQARERGQIPYLIKQNHEKKSRDENRDMFFEQVKKLHDKTGISEKDRYKAISHTRKTSGYKGINKPAGAYRGRDKLIGHSEGANVALYAAQDPRIQKYGIGRSYAVEPSPTGMKLTNADQRATDLVSKMMGVELDKDDYNNPKARKEAVKLYSKEPLIDTYILSGRQSGLVSIKGS